MHHIMFDVDGTLVESFKFDEECYKAAVKEVLGHKIDCNWSGYPHVTDAGILAEHLRRNDVTTDLDAINTQVKAAFIANISDHLASSPVPEIPGAGKFLSYLRKQADLSLSIATGGWRETAELKLASAGIDITGIPLASSNDHYSRTEIMKTALRMAEVADNCKLTYFGDAEWDEQACKDLQWNFILVGDRLEHHQTVKDLAYIELACRYIGLQVG